MMEMKEEALNKVVYSECFGSAIAERFEYMVRERKDIELYDRVYFHRSGINWEFDIFISKNGTVYHQGLLFEKEYIDDGFDVFVDLKKVGQISREDLIACIFEINHNADNLLSKTLETVIESAEDEVA